MMNRIHSNVKKIERPLSFWILSTFAFILVCTYVYFINGAIVATVAHTTAHNESVLLASSLSNLESEYFALSATVDTTYAQESGFVAPTQNVRYVSLLSGSTKNLSFNSGI
jgi:hypothetical protein